MNNPKRPPPRFVPTLTEVVQARQAYAAPADWPAEPQAETGPQDTASVPPAELAEQLIERILPAAHAALQAEIDQFAQSAHARLEDQLRNIVEEVLQSRQSSSWI